MLSVRYAERDEGFGIVFLEAMAYSKTVIGGAHAGTPSVIKDGETGILVKRSDFTGIASAIVTVLRDEELRHRLGRLGHQRLLDIFTFARFDADIRELLESQL